jgi:hypothetical protein
LVKLIRDVAADEIKFQEAGPRRRDEALDAKSLPAGLVAG